MKSSDLVTICTVALGTAAITVATLGTGPLEAGKDGAPAENPRPKLVAHGVELTLKAANAHEANGLAFKAGDAPVFELTALNTNATPADIRVRVVLSSSAPADMLSRVVQMPAMFCQEERQLSLRGRETKTVTIAPQTRLPADKFISVSLLEVDPAQTPTAATASVGSTNRLAQVFAQPGITMLSFSTAVPKPVAQPQSSLLVNVPELQASPAR